VSSASDEHIAELDRALELDGEDIVIRRLFGTQLIPLNVECRAFVRNVGNQELIAGIAQENSNVIMSPSQIIASGWPGPWTPSANETVEPDIDRRVPRKGDKCVIQGKARNIDIAKPIYVDNELVRIELRVLG
jgi:hypothetical protein